MKLPVGTISQTVNGGEESIMGLVDRLVSSRFTGYLEVKRTVKAGECWGQLVFKDGNAVLAEHSVARRAKAGKASLRSLVRSFTKKKAVIEVHEGIDADLMMALFKNASISPADFDLNRIIGKIKQKKGKRKN